MDYSQALEYLYQFELYGIKLGLDNIRQLLNLLGNPEKQLKFVHIAGTNGKGSVSCYLANILECAGYKTGLYTSPHLSFFEERIRINRVSISPDELVKQVEKIKAILDNSPELTPTFFEVTTALSLRYFADKSVDYVVLEVGLGGRLDATNVVIPELSVITNIDYDHMQQLGTSLADIAYEKAGIIKPGIPVITGASGTALEVIRKTAQEKNSLLWVYPDDFCTEQISKGEFNYSSKNLTLSSIKTTMLGRHQVENAALAIRSAAELLNLFRYESSVPLVDNSPITAMMSGNSQSSDIVSPLNKLIMAIYQGIEQMRWPGRLEVVKNNPIVLLDGAHNEAGAKVLYQSLKNDFQYKKLILVVGLTEGKERESLLKILIPLADKVVLTAAHHRRAVQPEYLQSFVASLEKPVQIANDTQNAVEYALNMASSEDLVCITGSLYIVGEVRPIFCSESKDLFNAGKN